MAGSDGATAALAAAGVAYELVQHAPGQEVQVRHRAVEQGLGARGALAVAVVGAVRGSCDWCALFTSALRRHRPLLASQAVAAAGGRATQGLFLRVRAPCCRAPRASPRRGTARRLLQAATHSRAHQDCMRSADDAAAGRGRRAGATPSDRPRAQGRQSPPTRPTLCVATGQEEAHLHRHHAAGH